MINIIQTGFTLWGLHFNRHVEQLDGWNQYDQPQTWTVDLITNYAALKHLVPTGKTYIGANDNDINKAA